MKPKLLVIWNLHKHVRNKLLVRVAHYIQYRYFKNNKKLITWYTDNVEMYGSESAKNYIIKNRTLVSRLYNKNLVREFIINYRSRFDTSRPTKLYNDFIKYISTKKETHTSDVAIACNILTNASITVEQQISLLDFVINRLEGHLPNLSKLNNSKHIELKKSIVLNKFKELNAPLR